MRLVKRDQVCCLGARGGESRKLRGLELGSMFQSLLRGPRGVRVGLYMLIDAALAATAVFMAFVLRLEHRWSEFLSEVPWLYAAAIAATLATFWSFGLYRSPVRFATSAIIYRVFQAGTVASALIMASVYLLHDGVVPRGAMVILWGLLVALTGAIRMMARDLVRWYGVSGNRVPVAIYGAGSPGHQLATALRHGSEFRPVAFIDDAQQKLGQSVGGIAVFESSNLDRLIEEKGIKEVLLAVPAASRARQREIVAMLSRSPVVVRVVPSVEDIASGRRKVEELRRIEIGDILGRESVAPMPELVSRAIRGRSVLVTGAGGSIGSELCRNVFRHQPKRLVLVENSEFALYSISKELGELNASSRLNIELVAILANVCDRDQLFRTMQSCDIEEVFHAAAYKHVPLVEQNAVEGVRNNVFGTLQCALAAQDAGVDTFVLISTDKAVRPTNVMGATKRLAEMILQALADQSTKPRFCMVRFGNVLASSGSVVPLFNEQIAKGGPITVTHPEITRYFMTIPEAASLVVQASAMAGHGDVFVLDMGEPIRIADLAQRMVHLAGLRVRDEKTPTGDIEIAYSGMRPGEKLHEELLIGSNVEGTEHPMIMRAREEKLDWAQMQPLLARLEVACDSYDTGMVLRILGEAVSGYTPDARSLEGLGSIADRLRVIRGGRLEGDLDGAIQQAAS
jgi:FlaA1/EpsC-like NDP-sugar epimerase